jgi:hypothetical protein
MTSMGPDETQLPQIGRGISCTRISLNTRSMKTIIAQGEKKKTNIVCIARVRCLSPTPSNWLAEDYEFHLDCTKSWT